MDTTQYPNETLRMIPESHAWQAQELKHHTLTRHQRQSRFIAFLLSTNPLPIFQTWIGTWSTLFFLVRTSRLGLAKILRLTCQEHTQVESQEERLWRLYFTHLFLLRGDPLCSMLFVKPNLPRVGCCCRRDIRASRPNMWQAIEVSWWSPHWFIEILYHVT